MPTLAKDKTQTRLARSILGMLLDQRLGILNCSRCSYNVHRFQTDMTSPNVTAQQFSLSPLPTVEKKMHLWLRWHNPPKIFTSRTARNKRAHKPSTRKTRNRESSGSMRLLILPLLGRRVIFYFLTVSWHLSTSTLSKKILLPHRFRYRFCNSSSIYVRTYWVREY